MSPRGSPETLADAASLAVDDTLRDVPDAIAGCIPGIHALQDVALKTGQIGDRLHMNGALGAMYGPGNLREPSWQLSRIFDPCARARAGNLNNSIAYAPAVGQIACFRRQK
jgi:hypothetical protein